MKRFIYHTLVILCRNGVVFYASLLNFPLISQLFVDMLQVFSDFYFEKKMQLPTFAFL